MKLERKNFVLLSIISVIFFAGCVQQTSTTPTAQGIIIKSFAPDQTDVDGGSTVTFFLNVQNVGGKAGQTGFNKVSGLLYGLSNEWRGVPNYKEIATGLKPSDPVNNLPGEEATQTWDVVAPAGKGSDITYDASLRVMYGYQTESNSLLRVVTRTYLRTNPNVQKGVITSTTSGGPLLVTVTARTPVISDTDPKGRIQFEIQNVGGGRVIANYHPTTDPIAINDIDVMNSLTISAQGVPLDCSGTGGGTFSVDNNNPVRLAGGKSTIISCDFNAASISNFQDLNINLVAKYAYFVDTTTKITVHKALQ